MVPFNEIANSQVALDYGAMISKISEEQLCYLMRCDLIESEVIEMIVMELNRFFFNEMVEAIGW